MQRSGSRRKQTLPEAPVGTLCSGLSGEVVSDRPQSSAGPPPQLEVTAAPLNLLPAPVLDHVSIVLRLSLVHLL